MGENGEFAVEILWLQVCTLVRTNWCQPYIMKTAVNGKLRHRTQPARAIMPRRRNVNPRQQQRSPSPLNDEVDACITETHDAIVKDDVEVEGMTQDGSAIAGLSMSTESAVKAPTSALTVLYCEGVSPLYMLPC